jgi:hypothetical protein
MGYDYSATTRSYRASSAMPDSLHRLRLYDNDPFVNRSLSVAREIIEEPLPSIKSTHYKDYFDTRDSLGEPLEDPYVTVNFFTLKLKNTTFPVRIYKLPILAPFERPSISAYMKFH